MQPTFMHSTQRLITYNYQPIPIHLRIFNYFCIQRNIVLLYMNRTSERLPYVEPTVEVFQIQQRWSILETASLEGDVMDFEDGDNF